MGEGPAGHAGDRRGRVQLTVTGDRLSGRMKGGAGADWLTVVGTVGTIDARMRHRDRRRRRSSTSTYGGRMDLSRRARRAARSTPPPASRRATRATPGSTGPGRGQGHPRRHHPPLRGGRGPLSRPGLAVRSGGWRHPAVEALTAAGGVQAPPGDHTRASSRRGRRSRAGADPSQRSHSSPWVGWWKATLRSRVGAMNGGSAPGVGPVGRGPAGQVDEDHRAGRRRATGRRRSRWAGSAATPATGPGGDRPGGQSVLEVEGLGVEVVARRRTAVGAPRGPARPCSSAHRARGGRARSVSSCSRPSTSPTLHTVASRIGRPSWVTSTRWEATVRPSLRASTAMSTGPKAATPR